MPLHLHVARPFHEALDQVPPAVGGTAGSQHQPFPGVGVVEDDRHARVQPLQRRRDVGGEDGEGVQIRLRQAVATARAFVVDRSSRRDASPQSREEQAGTAVHKIGLLLHGRGFGGGGLPLEEAIEGNDARLSRPHERGKGRALPQCVGPGVEHAVGKVQRKVVGLEGSVRRPAPSHEAPRLQVDAE